MNPRKFAFATDLHGNLNNVDRFLEEAAARDTRYVIFGGDIAPKQMAIQSSDDKALVLGPPSHFSRRLSLLEDDAQAAYQKGYILMPDEEEGDKLLQIYEIIWKLNDFVEQSEVDQFRRCIWQPKDFDILGDEIARIFIEHVKNDKMANGLYERLLQKLKKLPYAPENPSIEDIWQAFVDNQKIDYLQVNRIKAESPQGAKILGVEETDGRTEHIRIANEAMSLRDHYDTLIRNFCTSSPYVRKWNDVEQNIQLHSLAGQQRSIRDLISKIAQFREQTRAQVVTLLGNDDHVELEDEFRQADDQGILKYAGNRVVQLDDEVQVLGYPHVLPLPFNFAQWYKGETEIAQDLAALEQKIREGVRFTLLNTHMPPSQTALALGKIKSDQVQDWGSNAIREFVERVQPSHVFTGHLHQSWMISGKTQDRIGNSHIYNPGASIVRPRFLYGDLQEPDQVELVT